MWGNRLGWLISAVLVLAMAGTVVAAYVVSGRRTQPTEYSQNAANLAAIQLPLDPHALLPDSAKASRDGDVGEIYWRAVVDYQSHPESYERQASSFNLQTATELAGVRAALEAAEYAKATIFAKRVNEAVGYASTPAVSALHQVGAILGRTGTEYARNNQYAEAKRYLHAEFTLGLRLFDERMTRQQLSAGLGLMAHAATVLGQVAASQGEKELADRLSDYCKAQRAFVAERIEPMARVITSIDPTVQPTHVGDVFVIAERSAERVWRVEATLKLGMYKYNTNTAGDRRAAIRKVRELLADPDPAVAAAAQAARNLTLESYRTLGSR